MYKICFTSFASGIAKEGNIYTLAKRKFKHYYFAHHVSIKKKKKTQLVERRWYALKKDKKGGKVYSLYPYVKSPLSNGHISKAVFHSMANSHTILFKKRRKETKPKETEKTSKPKNKEFIQRNKVGIQLKIRAYSCNINQYQ